MGGQCDLSGLVLAPLVSPALLRHMVVLILFMVFIPEQIFKVLTSFRGCLTPKQIVNVTKELTTDSGDIDFSLLDGFNELTDELQEKVRKAIEVGHVEDEEWNGVSSPSSICTLGSFPLKWIN